MANPVKEQPFSTLKPTDLSDPTLFKVNNLLNFLAEQIAKNQQTVAAISKVVQIPAGGGGSSTTTINTGGATGPQGPPGPPGPAGGGGGGGGGTPATGWTTLTQIQYPVTAWATGMNQPIAGGDWFLQGGVSVPAIAGDSSVAISQELWMTFQGLGYTVAAQAWYDGAAHAAPSPDFIAQWPQEAYQITGRGIQAGLVPPAIAATFNANPGTFTGGGNGTVTLIVDVVPVITTIQYLDWAFAHQTVDVMTGITLTKYVLAWTNGLIT